MPKLGKIPPGGGWRAEGQTAANHQSRTDNAWAYKWSLREVVADLGARQIFIKNYCPW